MTKFAKVLLLLLFPCLALAQQNQQREGTAIQNVSSYAKLIPHAQITLCNYNAQFQCSVPVPIYSDQALTSPITYPFLADGNGNYDYFAPAGTYIEQICITANQCYTRPLTLISGGSGGGGGASPNPPLYSIQAYSSTGGLISDASITINPSTHSLSSPGVNGSVWAFLEPGSDQGQQVINAIAAAGPGQVVKTQGLTGNWTTQVKITQDNVTIDCSGTTFNFTGQDQGQVAGVIDVQANNFNIFGGVNGQPCNFFRGTGTNIQTLMYLRQPSKYINIHDIYFDGNRAGQNCPELTCFYAEVKSDPTGASTGDIRMWNVTFENGMSRPFDFRSVNNLWIHHFKVEHCDTINPNFGCEAGSIDEGGVFANGIGGTSIANGGSLYPTNGSAVLAFSAPHAGGIQATGTPIIANGVPNNLTLLTTAHDFTGPPWVKITDSTGKNTTASATISGQITSVTVQNGGVFSGSPAGTLIWNNEPGTGGILIATYAGGGLVSCSFTGGTNYVSGYVTGTPVSATGTGAFVVLTVGPGGVGAGCSVKNAGENYANTDTLALTQVGGTGGTCPAQFTGSAISGCQTGTLVGGDGYFSSQTAFQLNLTSGTQVTAPLLTGVVTFYVKTIQFTNVTSGYTAPTCTMGGGGSATIPPATCSVGIGNGVWIGTNMIDKGTGYYVAGDPAPTVALTAGTGSGASGIPQQQIILNPTTNVFVSDGLISDYSDSFATGRCVNCHLSRMTLLGRPYWGETPRATAGGIDMADCISCDADQIIIKGANGPQFGFIGFDIVGVTTVMPQHNQLSNFEFDPTATAPGVTPQDISGFDQLLEVGAASQPATCTDIGISHGHMVGVRMIITNCDHVTVDNVQFTNINPIQGIHAAIDLHPYSFIPQVLQSIDIHNNTFSTTDASITSAVLYESALTGNYPFTQNNNIYENGIAPYLDPGGIMAASVDVQTMQKKYTTLYGTLTSLPYGPEWSTRAATGTQGTPGQLSIGAYCGAYMFRPYSAAGQGPDASGFIYAGGLICTQLGTPVGGVVSAAQSMMVQDPLGSGNLVQAEIWEPGANISEQMHYFVKGITLGTSGPTWTFGATTPSGSCAVNGSFYSNTAGTTTANTTYRCIAGTWTAF